MPPRLSILLPTLDERDAIDPLLDALSAALGDRLEEVVVVDDGSTDGTRDRVRARGAGDARVRLLTRDVDPGLARALQAGIDATHAPLVGWMDADGSMDARDVVRLLSAVDAGADVAVGSRYVDGGGIKGQRGTGVVARVGALLFADVGADSRLAVAASWLLNAALLPLVLGDGAHDYTSGFLVARRSALEGLRLRGEHGEYFVDLWTRLARRGARIVEVPVVNVARRAGRSKTAPSARALLRRGVRYLLAVARLGAASGPDSHVQRSP